MTEELNLETEANEAPEVEKSSEGTEKIEPSEEAQEVSEESKEEAPIEAPKKAPEGYYRGPDGLLYNQEYPEERFQKMFPAWQKDSQDLARLKKDAKPETKPNSDDALVDYFYKKFEEKKVKDEEKIQEAVKNELEEVKTIYPTYTEKQLLEVANELSTQNRPASLMTAAIHLAKIDETIKAREGLTAKDIERKKGASAISGRSGFQTASGIRDYDSQKDSQKSIDELIDEGKQELGIK